MLLRISLIVAILAGLGAGVVSYLEISDKIPALTKQRDDEHQAKVTEIADHGKTKPPRRSPSVLTICRISLQRPPRSAMKRGISSPATRRLS
jgi:hypothetical protein